MLKPPNKGLPGAAVLVLVKAPAGPVVPIEYVAVAESN